MHHSQFNPSLSFNDDKLMMGRCQEMVNYFPSLKWVGMYTEEDPLIHLFNEKHKRDDCISAYRVATAPSCVNTYPCAGGVLTKFNERDNHPCVTMECILSLVNYCLYLLFILLHPNYTNGMKQKYSRLRCLLRVKGFVIGFYLGWSGSILRFRKI